MCIFQHIFIIMFCSRVIQINLNERAARFLPVGRICGGEANSSERPHRRASAELSEPCTETKLHPENTDPSNQSLKPVH